MMLFVFYGINIKLMSKNPFYTNIWYANIVVAGTPRREARQDANPVPLHHLGEHILLGHAHRSKGTSRA